jgi:hypothetical protein
MASATPPTPAAAPQRTAPPPTEFVEIKIVSHSTLLYWWPVWAVGLVLGFWSILDGHLMAIVPKATQLEPGKSVQEHDVLVLPKEKHLASEAPHLHISANKSLGVFFVTLLLIIIVITNVPLRGLWSFFVLVTVVLLSIIFSLAGWWEHILDALGRLHVHINAAGYLVFSFGLLAIWLIVFLLFDPQIYMVFTPGQLRVREEIGGGESAYDTAGMIIQKQRNDLFRHWVLGLGSGDLLVTTSGATAHHFNLPNVLFVGQKVRQIEDMLREKPVVQG